MSKLCKDILSTYILISIVFYISFGCKYIYLPDEIAPYPLDTCAYNATFSDGTEASFGYYCQTIDGTVYAQQISYDAIGCKGNEISGDLILCNGGNTNCFCDNTKDNCLHSEITTYGYNEDANECGDTSTTNTTTRYVVLVCVSGLGITCDHKNGPIKTQFHS
eukprot:UN00409